MNQSHAPRQIGLVVFDIGGVLVRHTRTWQASYERAGLSVPEPDPQFEARLEALPRRDVGAISSEEFYVLFAEASRGRFSAEDARRITDSSLLGEYPGISRVFDVLEAVHVETAILSNTYDAHWARYFASKDEAEFPTLARVRHRFASHLIGLLKPDPRAYRRVEMSTGYEAGRILYFDDLPENIEAARTLGWTAELIDYAGDTGEQMLRFLRVRGVIP